MIEGLTAWLAAHWAAAELTWRDVPGYLGALLIVASFLTRRMIPLRALSALSNVFLIVYAFVAGQYPALVMNAALLPMNLVRLAQMVKLVRRVRVAAGGDRTMDWLKPYMRRRRCGRGKMLFRKGETANAMFYIVSGRFRIVELGIGRAPGEFVGELGLLAPGRQRTQSLVCEAEGDVLEISYDEIHELFFQNPDFGFYFMQLAAGRLFHTLELLQQELGKRVNEPELPGK